jgi:thioredoxin reductase
LSDVVTSAAPSKIGFDLHTASGQSFDARKLIFATGIRDIMADLDGYAACWGISVIHCPYCHGYEVRDEKTGILGNGEYAFEFSGLISNWTKDLTLFTNGPSTLTPDQTAKLERHNIGIVETEIERLDHAGGQLQRIVFKNGTSTPLKALYARSPFEQHCSIPEALGCERSEEGYLKIDPMQRTSTPGVFACGDNATRIRTVANAVSMGTTAGMMVNKELIAEDF